MTTDKLPVNLRPASPDDTEQVLALSRMIWDGDDYIPQVWQDWLDDPHGRLLIAEHEGHIVGLGKLTRLSDSDWWLEGLRVHPEFEGRGIGAQIYEAMLVEWDAIGHGALRLVTGANRAPVHHLSQRLGFQRIGEIIMLAAPTQVEAEQLDGVQGDAPTLPFRPLAPEEAEEALRLANQNPCAPLMGNLIDMGWKWGQPTIDFIQEAIEQHCAWWWRGRQGLLLYYLDSEEDDAPEQPCISLLATEPANITPLLNDFRRLAAAMHHAHIDWHVRLHPDLLTSLAQAGFERTWEGSLLMFEKQTN